MADMAAASRRRVVRRNIIARAASASGEKSAWADLGRTSDQASARGRGGQKAENISAWWQHIRLGMGTNIWAGSAHQHQKVNMGAA